jgi:hypothetical protein
MSGTFYWRLTNPPGDNITAKVEQVNEAGDEPITYITLQNGTFPDGTQVGYSRLRYNDWLSRFVDTGVEYRGGTFSTIPSAGTRKRRRINKKKKTGKRKY